jgi:hypothetical protein
VDSKELRIREKRLTEERTPCVFVEEVKRLSDAIRGKINRLRDFRNQFVHNGLKKEEVSEQLAAELLPAAIFGFEYLRCVGPRLVAGPAVGVTPSTH